MAVQIRELNRQQDRRPIEAIDTAFDTDVIFDLAIGERGIELVEHRLERAITKRFLYIEGAWRRRGLGRALLESIESFQMGQYGL